MLRMVRVDRTLVKGTRVHAHRSDNRQKSHRLFLEGGAFLGKAQDWASKVTALQSNCSYKSRPGGLSVLAVILNIVDLKLSVATPVTPT